MRSLVRYSLIALGLMALAITVAVFRPRLEQKAMAQIPTGCNPAVAPNKTDPENPNRCLVISSFRENGPAGTGDEYVELFNASIIGVNVSDLSSDPQGTAQGIGIFASTGNGCPTNIGGGCVGAANASTLVCQIPGSVNIPGRGYYLCVGTAYSLNNLGINGGTTHSACLVGDRTTNCQLIGAGNATGNNIPDDAGLALLDIGTQIIDACDIGGFLCTTGFQYSGGVRPNAIVYDKVGFDPYQQGAPAPGYPTFADQYCETKCLAPVGDMSVITAGQLQGTCPPTVTQAGATWPVIQHSTLLNGVARCYGESGQYKIERRRAASSFLPNPNAGDIHRDTQNNADDFILLAPNPSSFNVGVAITGNAGVTSVLGAAGPHTRKSPPILGQGVYTGAAFDINNANQLGASNAERRYNLDPNILNPSNNPQGTFILRIRFVNNGNATVTGGRFRIDDISGMCGNQTGIFATGVGTGNPHVAPPTNVAGLTAAPATQEARNLRLPIFPALTPVPNCQGEGSDAGGAFTAILKAVNMNAEQVSQASDGTLFFVNGSSIEDIAVAAAAPPNGGTNLSPLGGGGDNSLVINSQLPSNAVGDGVSGGPGTFAFTQPASGSTTSSTRVLRVGFRFGVVRAGRFKVLLGREMAGPSPVN
ncbi:MAG TPA: hypothetical protein VEW46_09635 [Pyrinomonadaceae bacterium]|nr:hypothetical protein [Pyrinomonadaceae bacterium]